MCKDWTKFEKSFLLIGSIAAILTTFIFNGTFIYIGYTLLYFWAAILLAKGKYFSYIIGIISMFFYAYISYTNAYYGEVIISVCCNLPLMIIGLRNWIKHKDKNNTVYIKDITNNELKMVLISQVVLFVLYYQILKVFNTQNLIISTLSVVASVVSTYLFARRSEYGFIGYVINDIIIIVLWGLPVIRGDLSVIPVLLCPVLLLINDTYGVHNWRVIKRRQRRFRKQCKYKNSNANGRIKQGNKQEEFDSNMTGNI